MNYNKDLQRKSTENNNIHLRDDASLAFHFQISRIVDSYTERRAGMLHKIVIFLILRDIINSSFGKPRYILH